MVEEPRSIAPIQVPAADERGCTLRVLLADDSLTFLKTLRRFLARQADVEVVGEAHNGNEALALAQQLGPDIIILDLQMPERSGIEIIADLRRLRPETRIIVLSLFNWQQFTRTLGAHAYVSKANFITELLPAIADVIAGKSTLPKASYLHSNLIADD